MAGITRQTRIAIIGGGKMGSAVMGGWIAAKEGIAAQLGADSFIVANPGGERREYLKEAFGVACVPAAREIPAADIAVIAVKPQTVMGMLADIAGCPQFEGCLFISLAGGLTTGRIAAALPRGARLVRAMPNTPLLVGAGATALCAPASASAQDRELVRALFACLGEVYEVDEGLMDATSALSGSGPAYVAAMIEALAAAGAAQGLDAGFAEQLVCQTVYGTAQLLHSAGQSPEEVRVAVSSPGGSTLAALAAFSSQGLDQAYASGVAAAIRRSKEQAAC